MTASEHDPADGLGDPNQEIEILKSAKRTNIEDDADDQGPFCLQTLRENCEQPGCADLDHKQRNKTNVPPAVKRKRSGNEHPLTQHGRRCDRIVCDNRNRQKYENEKLRVKEHPARVPAMSHLAKSSSLFKS